MYYVILSRTTIVVFLFFILFVIRQAALVTVQPSAKREGFATIPDVTWDDVGALKDVREELTMAILVRCNIGSSIGPISMLRFLYTVSLFSLPVVVWEIKF